MTSWKGAKDVDVAVKVLTVVLERKPSTCRSVKESANLLPAG